MCRLAKGRWSCMAVVFIQDRFYYNTLCMEMNPIKWKWKLHGYTCIFKVTALPWVSENVLLTQNLADFQENFDQTLQNNKSIFHLFTIDAHREIICKYSYHCIKCDYKIYKEYTLLKKCLAMSIWKCTFNMEPDLQENPYQTLHNNKSIRHVSLKIYAHRIIYL